MDSITCENKFLNFYQSQKIDYRSLDFVLLFKTFPGVTEDLTYTVPMNRFVDYPSFKSYINAVAKTNDGHPVEIKVNDPDPYAYPTYTLNLEFLSGDHDGHPLVGVKLLGGGWEKLGVKLGEYYNAEGDTTVKVLGNSIYDFSSPPVILVNLDPIFGPGAISNAFGTHTFALQNTASFGDKIFFTNTQRSTCNSVYSPGHKQTMRYLQVTLLSCD